jgi:MFS transporter, PAT family, beta-lactamase induction signal transducer AmpG
VIPYAYMQMLDGYGYKLAGGVAGSFAMDAVVSLAACILLLVPVMGWLRAGKLETDSRSERLPAHADKLQASLAS